MAMSEWNDTRSSSGLYVVLAHVALNPVLLCLPLLLLLLLLGTG
jgi:hypothetical protein